MPLQSAFRWRKEDNRLFLQQFARLRHASDLRFLALHAFATTCYISKVMSPTAQLVGLIGAVLPLLLEVLSLTGSLRPVPRGLLVLMVSVT